MVNLRCDRDMHGLISHVWQNKYRSRYCKKPYVSGWHRSIAIGEKNRLVADTRVVVRANYILPPVGN